MATITTRRRRRRPGQSRDGLDWVRPMRRQRKAPATLAGLVASFMVLGIARQIGYDSRSGWRRAKRGARAWAQKHVPRPVRWFAYGLGVLGRAGYRGVRHSWRTVKTGALNGVTEGVNRHEERLSLREFPKRSTGYEAQLAAVKAEREKRRDAYREGRVLTPEVRNVSFDGDGLYQVRRGIDVIPGLTKEQAAEVAAQVAAAGLNRVRVQEDGARPGAPAIKVPVPPEPTPLERQAAYVAAQEPPSNGSSSNYQIKPSDGFFDVYKNGTPVHRAVTHDAAAIWCGDNVDNWNVGIPGWRPGDPRPVQPTVSSRGTHNGGGRSMTAFSGENTVPGIQEAIQTHIMTHEREVTELTVPTVLQDFKYREQHRSGLEQAAASNQSSEAVQAALTPLMDVLAAAKEHAATYAREAKGHSDAVLAEAGKAVAALQPLVNLGEEATAIKAGDDLKVLKPA
jgi:hypothetical protein